MQGHFFWHIEVSFEDRFYCIEVSPEDRFYCIEVSLEDRFYCIEVPPEDRSYCIEVPPEDRFYCTKFLSRNYNRKIQHGMWLFTQVVDWLFDLIRYPTTNKLRTPYNKHTVWRHTTITTWTFIYRLISFTFIYRQTLIAVKIYCFTVYYRFYIIIKSWQNGASQSSTQIKVCIIFAYNLRYQTLLSLS